MYLVINNGITVLMSYNLSCHHLLICSTSDTGTFVIQHNFT